jgi:Sec-independent protein secretion pathway component TatC
MLAMPLWLLYEAGIVVASWMKPINRIADVS